MVVADVPEIVPEIVAVSTLDKVVTFALGLWPQPSTI